MADQKIEDHLRNEYFGLLPEIRRVAHHLETEIRYRLLSVSGRLENFEQLTVKSRVKECESAVESLRRGQMDGNFVPGRSYSLKDLNDLAGVRVLAFPRRLLTEVDATLRTFFPTWTPDPVLDKRNEVLAFTYHGFCDANAPVRGEYQVVSTLIGLFWEVEHDAVYKPAPQLRGLDRNPHVQLHYENVLWALRQFEEAFEVELKSSSM